jgi:hypothetical protein
VLYPQELSGPFLAIVFLPGLNLLAVSAEETRDREEGGLEAGQGATGGGSRPLPLPPRGGEVTMRSLDTGLVANTMRGWTRGTWRRGESILIQRQSTPWDGTEPGRVSTFGDS